MKDGIFSLDKGNLYEIKKSVDARKNPIVFYAAPNNRCHLASAIGRPFVYVAGDWVDARKIFERISEYGEGNYALMPEREDVLIKRKVCNYAALRERLDILKKMADGKLDGLVITCESLLQFYPEKNRFSNSFINIEKGKEIKTSDFADRLVSVGYKRVEEVVSVAEFSLSGDRFEIFPINGANPFRVEFFGDEVEKIRPFTVETRLLQKEIKSFEIMPATDILVNRDEADGILFSLKRARRNSGAEAAALIDGYAEELTRNFSSPLNTFLISFLRKGFSTIYPYMSAESVLVLDDVRLIEDKLKLTRRAFCNRVDELADGGKLPRIFENGIPDYETISEVGHRILGFGRVTSAIAFYKPNDIFDLKTSPLPSYYADMEGFFVSVKQMLILGVKIHVFVRTQSSADALEKAFNEHDFGIERGFGNADARLCIGVGNVSYGFYYPVEKLLCVGINDLTRRVTVTENAQRKRAVFELPAKGDYVVHEKHGIGISEGMQKVKTLSGEKDFYVVLYRGGDRLYLPVEQLDTIEKYNGGDKPQLHKLGGAEFEKVKERVRKSIKEMAFDLLSVYQARYNAKGFAYDPDTPWQKEFEDDFEFTETDDQITAINEIKRDMESGKIMDRLLCGDVGYGKTEVALRAVFKTVMNGKQAAVLAPTTILAQQHYNLICARMKKFNIKIELLSRFVPKNEIAESLKRIEKGESDIVVATHRILSSDVRFSDLGLLVLDEEQRFGVEHKEKLKAYRNDVNVLSLSATPIPRTLHMALSGIRDISTLETPPKNRLPVETYVTEYTDDLLKDALGKELSRGGQTFVLYNRVGGIEKFYEKVCSLTPPDAGVVFAHGQMDADELEDAVKKFYDNDAKVLVSTTIIENGIDLPNANTLFVVDADRLGLSQLYQLRGRVGRSGVLAYAYFTVPENKVLTENAVQRLDALMSNTDLGSGFRIAMRDLEIRGAGNVLGREQHGQMEKVGYEMYLRLVKEGIDEARGIPVVSEREPELKIDGDIGISDAYISDTQAKVAVYKTAATLASTEEGEEYYKKLSAVYGQSGELKHVIRVGVLRNLAKKAGVSKVVADSTGTGIFFYDTKCLADAKLFAALEKYRDTAVLCPSDTPAVVFRKGKASVYSRVKQLKDFLEEAFGERADAN